MNTISDRHTHITKWQQPFTNWQFNNCQGYYLCLSVLKLYLLVCDSHVQYMQFTVCLVVLRYRCGFAHKVWSLN